MDRKKQLQDANRAFDELRQFYFANAVWLDPDSCEKIESLLETVWKISWDYLDDLDERLYPQTVLGRAAGNRLLEELQPLRRELEAEFRAILYPQLWYEPLRRFLERLPNRKSSDADRRSGNSESP